MMQGWGVPGGPSPRPVLQPQTWLVSPCQTPREPLAHHSLLLPVLGMLPRPGGRCPLPVPTPALPLSSLQEKRKRQTEIENKRRQLEDDRRQLQHLKVRIPRDPRAASVPGMWRDPPPLWGWQDCDPPLLPSPRLCGRDGCWRGPRPQPPRRTRP